MRVCHTCLDARTCRASASCLLDGVAAMTYDRNGALRVGILMDSFTLPAWAYEVLATLQQSAYARIQLIVLNDSFAPRRRGVFSKVVKNWNALLYLAYSRR